MTETRSDHWISIVLVGLTLSLVLALVAVRVIRRSLSTGTTRELRRALAAHRVQLTGAGALLALAVSATVLQLPSSYSERITAPETSSGGARPGAAGTGAVGQPAPAATGTTAPATASGRPGSTATAPTVALAPVTAVHLWDAAHDRIGITDDAIHICGHAPLSLGAVLNTKAEDLLVYWRYLNDHGGIYGRRVDVSLQDDQYSASGGVPAAQRCAEGNPFLLFGSIGSDVTPPVRQWAEQNKMLYLYGFSARAGSDGLQYSFTTSIMQEDLARILADVATTRFAGKRIGLLWRNSSNVQPGHDAFRKEAQAHGGQIVADLPVQQSQGNYTQEVIELQQKGAQVVMILDDAIAQTNVVLQGASQGYRPQWLVFNVNLQTQTLGDDALDPPLIGAQASPAYTPGEYGGPFAPYAADIREFEAAYAKYSPSTDLNGPGGDIAWQTWLGFKSLARLLLSCGPDCTRNRFAGMLEAGYQSPQGASCALDFRGDGHHGGTGVDLSEAYRRSNGEVAWRTYQRCATAR